MNSEVKTINTENGRITGVACIENGRETFYEGDIFMSSMPVNDLIAGMKGSPIPKTVEEAAADLPFRDFVTVGLLLNKLNLKNETKLKTLNNIVPDCWIYVQDTGVKLGRIQIFTGHHIWLRSRKNTFGLVWNIFAEKAMTFGICLMKNVLIWQSMSW